MGAVKFVHGAQIRNERCYGLAGQQHEVDACVILCTHNYMAQNMSVRVSGTFVLCCAGVFLYLQVNVDALHGDIMICLVNHMTGTSAVIDCRLSWQTHMCLNVRTITLKLPTHVCQRMLQSWLQACLCCTSTVIMILQLVCRS